MVMSTELAVKTLTELESIIERGLQTFIDVGLALLEIRDRRLYRDRYSTFDGYCRERWGWSRVHAHRHIEAAQMVQMLPMGNRPATERQARELVPLRHDEQQLVEVWRELKERHGDSLTAALVRDGVKARLRRIRFEERLEARREAARREMMAPFEGGVSPYSNGVLPLEVLWPTPKSLLQGYAATRLGGALSGLRHLGHWSANPEAEVLVVPGVAEALDSMRDAIETFQEAIVNVAESLEQIADTAPEHPIPWGGDRDTLLAANARQKNSRGYCGHLGCWQRVQSDSRCSAHPLGVPSSPASDRPPPDVFAPAAPDSQEGVRPGWTAWGLEL